MRSILFHCKEFRQEITGFATKPKDIIHGQIREKQSNLIDCILVFVTVEVGDSVEKALALTEEVLQFCNDTSHRNVFLCPFAHLSSNLASSKDALPIFAELTKQLKASNVNLVEGHFGSDKEYLLHVYGHRGNTRYREF